MDSVQKRHAERYEYIQSKKDVPCADCGQSFPRICMDFHHINEEEKGETIKGYKGARSKSMSAIMQKWSVKKIDEELGKSVVVCSNCHRIRHSGD